MIKFHYLGPGKISNIVWNLSMSLGGSKAAFEYFINLILITASFLKLYMFKAYFHCYFTSKVEQSKANAEYNFTVLQMEFMQFLVVNVQSLIILIRVVRMNFSRQE